MSIFARVLAGLGFEFFAVPSSLHSSEAHADFLPPNTLSQQDRSEFTANISKEEFNRLIQNVVDAYMPLAQLHDATIKTYNDWEGATVNASAQQQGKVWLLNFFGGLARRPEVTADAFTLVVCHEMGHHFGGFPLKSLPATWSADEGEADYFATHACARKMWENEREKNAEARTVVDTFAQEKCDEAFQTANEQNLCYRAAMAGKSLGLLVSTTLKTPVPQFDSPDGAKVWHTVQNHPYPQCRLDTFFAGALCNVRFNENIIPGKRFLGWGANGPDAEREAYQSSCSFKAAVAQSQRPKCWFKPRENLQFSLNAGF